MRLPGYTRAACLMLFCASCSHPTSTADPDRGEHGSVAGSADNAPLDAGATEASKPPASICDGSPDVRLRFGLQASTSARDAGREFIYDNYFAVLGDCTYWILRDGWSEARTGALSDTDAAQLSAALRYGDWAELAGSYTSADVIFDAGPQLLTDGASTLACAGNCISPNDQVHRIFVAAEASMEHWYATGHAVNGPMKITGLIYPNAGWPENYHAVDWPLADDAPEYVYDPARQHSDRTVGMITDSDTLAALRELRTRKHEPKSLWNNLNCIPVNSAPNKPGSRVELYFRDVTPAEN